MKLCGCGCGEPTPAATRTRYGRLKGDPVEFLRGHGPKKIKHGHALNYRTSRTYKSWSGLVNRCTNPNNQAYANYGGRGITVCERWQGECGFENFLADMGERPEGREIDRINNEGNYEPGNCRWATRLEQRHNRRREPQLEKTHCPQGHPYAGYNLIIQKNGSRHCRECHRQRDRRRYYAQRA